MYVTEGAKVMAIVVTDLSMSLDGFIAGPNDGPANPMGDRGMRLFDWYTSGDVRPVRFYQDFGLSPESVAVFNERIETGGAVITGRRTYDIANAWGGDGPLSGAPVFVLTHRPPEEVPRGRATYTYVTDGIESAVAQAKQAAGDKAVSLMGSAAPQQALRAGLLDEIHIDLIPVLLGGGVRLFDHLGDETIELERTRVVEAPGVTHLAFRVIR
jgi:dihydrofolate reductase